MLYLRFWEIGVLLWFSCLFEVFLLEISLVDCLGIVDLLDKVFLINGFWLILFIKKGGGGGKFILLFFVCVFLGLILFVEILELFLFKLVFK